MGYIKAELKGFFFFLAELIEWRIFKRATESGPPDAPTMTELLDLMRWYLFMILNTPKGSLPNRIIRTISFGLSKSSLEIG